MEATAGAESWEQDFEIAVTNVAPTITSTAPATATEGVLYTYTVTATGTPAPALSCTGQPASLRAAANNSLVSCSVGVIIVRCGFVFIHSDTSPIDLAGPCHLLRACPQRCTGL